MAEKVAILGASDKADRYAHKAFKMLKEYGHTPLPVHPNLKEVEGIAVTPSLKEIKIPVDTLTMYVNPTISAKMKDEILSLKPKRVIFNPGTENAELQKSLEAAGIHTVEACTLVLLRTQQFEKA